MTYQGHIENGAIVLDDTVHLEEGLKVEIIVKDIEQPDNVTKRRTLHERLKPFIGMADGLPADGSLNLDHYLYGMPKKEAPSNKDACE